MVTNSLLVTNCASQSHTHSTAISPDRDHSAFFLGLGHELDALAIVPAQNPRALAIAQPRRNRDFPALTWDCNARRMGSYSVNALTKSSGEHESVVGLHVELARLAEVDELGCVFFARDFPYIRNRSRCVTDRAAGGQS